MGRPEQTSYIGVMSELHFTLFNTALGRCGIAWSARGITAMSFPEGSDEKTRARLLRKSPGATEAPPTADVQKIIARIVALLAGNRIDLMDIALDDGRLPDFNRKVYDIARTIPAGQTLTYGDIAKRLGDVALSRDVGQALGQNPIPIIVPCHRVLAANGKSGGFSAPGGVSTKLKLLSIEGAQPGGPDLFGDLPLAKRRA